MTAILILHGPNLNLLGIREPDVYGIMNLNAINERLKKAGENMGFEVRIIQSNSEGELINALHDAMEWAMGVVFNPGGYTHTSIALRDAVAAINIPVIEVHLSNVYSRDEFRHKSLIAPVCVGTIAGFGWRSYLLGMRGLVGFLQIDE